MGQCLLHESAGGLGHLDAAEQFLQGREQYGRASSGSPHHPHLTDPADMTGMRCLVVTDPMVQKEPQNPKQWGRKAARSLISDQAGKLCRQIVNERRVQPWIGGSNEGALITDQAAVWCLLNRCVELFLGGPWWICADQSLPAALVGTDWEWAGSWAGTLGKAEQTLMVHNHHLGRQ